MRYDLSAGQGRELATKRVHNTIVSLLPGPQVAEAELPAHFHPSEFCGIACVFSGDVDLVSRTRGTPRAYEPPMRMPVIKTSTPPTTTWNAALRNGVSMNLLRIH